MLLNKILIIYYYLLLISPFLAYFINGRFGLLSNQFFGSIALLLIVPILFKTRKRKTFNYSILIILVIYYFVWDIINEEFVKEGLIKYLFDNYTLHTICLLILIQNTKFNEETIRGFINVIKLLLIASFLFSFIQITVDQSFFTPPIFFEFFENAPIYGFRYSSIWGYAGANEIGFSFLPLLSIIIAQALFLKERWIFLWIIIGAFVSFTSNARYVMISFIIVISQIFITGYAVRWRKRLNISLIVLIVIISVIVFILPFIGYNLKDFYENRILSETIESRIISWQLFTKYFPLNPLWGSGVHVSPDLARELSGKTSQIHIGYISHLYTYGIVGSALVFGFWFSVLKEFWHFARKTKKYGSLFGYFVFLFANLTLVHYSLVSIGIIFLFIFHQYYRNQWEVNKWQNNISKIRLYMDDTKY